MFDIITSRDFLSKLEADYADYKKQPDSARLALNCIITAYHLYEWVWGDWLKKDYVTWKKLSIRDQETFRGWIVTAWPDFLTVEDLTNGTKHFTRKINTERIDGFGRGPYGLGHYGMPYLLIDHGSGAKAGQWQTVEKLLDDGITFWRHFFQDYRDRPRHNQNG